MYSRIWKIRKENSFPTEFYGETCRARGHDGVYFFGRYRYGVLRVWTSTESELAAVESETPVLELKHGDSGEMELEVFLGLLREHGLFMV